MPNIVKHSYIKGQKLTSRALAHLKYLQYRPGEDREPAGRRNERAGPGEQDLDGTQNKERLAARPLHLPHEELEAPGKASHDFKKALHDKDLRGQVVHKFILSPSEKDVDMNKYTMEVMATISRQKGQNLNYAWVNHDNTDHRHSHVIVLGKDQDGHNVRFSKFDYALMRVYGDRYLEREHGIELRYSHEIEMYARTHNHNLYASSFGQNMHFLQAQTKKSSWQTDEDFEQLAKINRYWQESLEGPAREGGLLLGSNWQHDRGRLSEIHDLFNNTKNTDLWTDVLKHADNQELKDYASKQLNDLKNQRQSTITELEEKYDLKPESFERFIYDLHKQFADEYREIDRALYPEKYLPRQYDRGEIDLAKVDSEDKILLGSGRTITKYDNTEYLEGVRQALIGRSEEWLPFDEYSKLCSWIGTKEVKGRDCYGEPPLKEQTEHKEHGETLTSQTANRESTLYGLHGTSTISHEDIDLSRVAAEDKIELGSGGSISKYDSRDFLEDVRQSLLSGDEARLEKADYTKLCSWIGTKDAHGDDHYGPVPLVNKEAARDITKEGGLAHSDSAELEAAFASLRSSDKDNELFLPEYSQQGRDLKEIDAISEHVSMTVNEALDLRESYDFEPKARDRTLEILERQEPLVEGEKIEQSRELGLGRTSEQAEIQPEPYRANYEIQLEFDPDDQKNRDTDFESKYDYRNRNNEDEPKTRTDEIEPLCDIDHYGGQELDEDRRTLLPYIPDRIATDISSPLDDIDDEHRRHRDELE